MRIKDIPQWQVISWVAFGNDWQSCLPPPQAKLTNIQQNGTTVKLTVYEANRTFSGCLDIDNADMAKKVSDALSNAIGKTLAEAAQIIIPNN